MSSGINRSIHRKCCLGREWSDVQNRFPIHQTHPCNYKMSFRFVDLVRFLLPSRNLN